MKLRPTIKCVCPNRPYCMYPHIYPIGSFQQTGGGHRDPKDNDTENRNHYLIPIDTLKTVNPKDYFITTGDLISKLKILEKDAFDLAFSVRRLINQAKKTQGNSQYLETSIDEDGRVLCQAKTTKAVKALKQK